MPRMPAWVHRLRPFAVPIGVAIGILLSIGLYQTLVGTFADAQIINSQYLMNETIQHVLLSGVSFAIVVAIGVPLTRAAGPSPGTELYSVVVRNDGTAAAGPFEVSLNVGGVALAPVSLPSLSADSTQLVQFTGPRCAAGSSVVATADPGNSLAEPANANRTRSFACR